LKLNKNSQYLCI